MVFGTCPYCGKESHLVKNTYDQLMYRSCFDSTREVQRNNKPAGIG